MDLLTPHYPLSNNGFCLPIPTRILEEQRTMGLTISVPKMSKPERQPSPESPSSSDTDGPDSQSSSDKEKYVYLPHPRNQPAQAGDENRQNVIQWHDEAGAGPSQLPYRLPKLSRVDSRHSPLPHVWRHSSPSQAASPISTPETTSTGMGNVVTTAIDTIPSKPGLEYPINQSTGMPRDPRRRSRSGTNTSSPPLTSGSKSTAPSQDDIFEDHVDGKQHRRMQERQALMARRRAERLRLRREEEMSAENVPSEPASPSRDKMARRERPD
jgi:hypothetical protein